MLDNLTYYETRIYDELLGEMGRKEPYEEVRRLSILFRQYTDIEKNSFLFEEFKTFRNEIFHDRIFNSEVTFNKTKFSSIPYLANQVDIVQSSVIALEIFEAFRFVYAGKWLKLHTINQSQAKPGVYIG